MATPADLTPTSFALLGLLNVRSWTTYELAQQMDRTINRFWPRARSKVYEEPKKLVAHGLAKATTGSVGRRPRTTYSITAKGRRVLAAWLADGATEPPVLESEHVMKVFFADGGTSADLLATLDDLRAWAHERTLANIERGRSYLGGSGPYPERAAILTVTSRFLDEFLELCDEWAEWATGIVEQWPDRPLDAEPDREALAETVRRAERRAQRWLRARRAAS